jgi:hypothetical protein
MRTNPGTELRKIPRDVFVNWALVWWDYRLLRGRDALGQEWGEEDKKRWKQSRTLADRLVPKANAYPEIWRLRADIIDVIPKKLQDDKAFRSDAEIKNDKEALSDDRRKYARN